MKRHDVERLLPEVFQRTVGPGTVLAGVLDGVVGVLERSENVLERLEQWFDPRHAPRAFVPMLARWVDLGALLEDVAGMDPNDDATARQSYLGGVGRLRELVSRAARLAKLRGTELGLKTFLETATGAPGFRVITDAARPFHIRVIAPPAAAALRELVARVVVLEKPVYVTCELEFEENREG